MKHLQALFLICMCVCVRESTHTFLQGMVLLKPTSSPLNLNSVPLESRQLMFGAGVHSTVWDTHTQKLTGWRSKVSNSSEEMNWVSCWRREACSQWGAHPRPSCPGSSPAPEWPRLSSDLYRDTWGELRSSTSIPAPNRSRGVVSRISTGSSCYKLSMVRQAMIIYDQMASNTIMRVQSTDMQVSQNWPYVWCECMWWLCQAWWMWRWQWWLG